MVRRRHRIKEMILTGSLASLPAHSKPAPDPFFAKEKRWAQVEENQVFISEKGTWYQASSEYSHQIRCNNRERKPLRLRYSNGFFINGPESDPVRRSGSWWTFSKHQHSSSGIWFLPGLRCEIRSVQNRFNSAGFDRLDRSSVSSVKAWVYQQKPFLPSLQKWLEAAPADEFIRRFELARPVFAASLVYPWKPDKKAPEEGAVYRRTLEFNGQSERSFLLKVFPGAGLRQLCITIDSIKSCQRVFASASLSEISKRSGKENSELSEGKPVLWKMLLGSGSHKLSFEKKYWLILKGRDTTLPSDPSGSKALIVPYTDFKKEAYEPLPQSDSFESIQLIKDSVSSETTVTWEPLDLIRSRLPSGFSWINERRRMKLWTEAKYPQICQIIFPKNEIFAAIPDRHLNTFQWTGSGAYKGPLPVVKGCSAWIRVEGPLRQPGADSRSVSLYHKLKPAQAFSFERDASSPKLRIKIRKPQGQSSLKIKLQNGSDAFDYVVTSHNAETWFRSSDGTLWSDYINLPVELTEGAWTLSSNALAGFSLQQLSESDKSGQDPPPESESGSLPEPQESLKTLSGTLGKAKNLSDFGAALQRRGLKLARLRAWSFALRDLGIHRRITGETSAESDELFGRLWSTRLRSSWVPVSSEWIPVSGGLTEKHVRAAYHGNWKDAGRTDKISPELRALFWYRSITEGQILNADERIRAFSSLSLIRDKSLKQSYQILSAMSEWETIFQVGGAFRKDTIWPESTSQKQDAALEDQLFPDNWKPELTYRLRSKQVLELPQGQYKFGFRCLSRASQWNRTCSFPITDANSKLIASVKADLRGNPVFVTIQCLNGPCHLERPREAMLAQVLVPGSWSGQRSATKASPGWWLPRQKTASIDFLGPTVLRLKTPDPGAPALMLSHSGPNGRITQTSDWQDGEILIQVPEKGASTLSFQASKDLYLDADIRVPKQQAPLPVPDQLKSESVLPPPSLQDTYESEGNNSESRSFEKVLARPIQKPPVTFEAELALGRDESAEESPEQFFPDKTVLLGLHSRPWDERIYGLARLSSTLTREQVRYEQFQLGGEWQQTETPELNRWSLDGYLRRASLAPGFLTTAQGRFQWWTSFRDDQTMTVRLKTRYDRHFLLSGDPGNPRVPSALWSGYRDHHQGALRVEPYLRYQFADDKRFGAHPYVGFNHKWGQTIADHLGLRLQHDFGFPGLWLRLGTGYEYRFKDAHRTKAIHRPVFWAQGRYLYWINGDTALNTEFSLFRWPNQNELSALLSVGLLRNRDRALRDIRPSSYAMKGWLSHEQDKAAYHSYLAP